MNRVLPLSRITRSMATCEGTFVFVFACSLTLSACASPLAPSAKPANFYEAVRSDVEGFWADEFSAYGATYTPISTMQLFTEEASSRCTGESVAFYCPVDEGVYLDSAFMQSQVSTFGKFGPAMIIAHEIGHHIQNLLGLTGGFTIFRELQADCLAGSWIGSAGARGLLDVGDFEEAAHNLFNLGDSVGTPWFHPNAHGTPQQRVEFFRVGFLSGIGGC